MSESDRWFSWINCHLRKPPGGPVETNRPVPGVRQLKWPVRGHLHQSSAIRSLGAELHVSIVWEMRRPMLHLTCQFEDLRHWCANESFVYGFHRPSDGHRAELERLWELRGHGSTGPQLVVTRNPRRRWAIGSCPTASVTVARSSSAVNPLMTETTPSWRLTA
jgi:hypothetical protein